jgi:hypothetical protein
MWLVGLAGRSMGPEGMGERARMGPGRAGGAQGVEEADDAREAWSRWSWWWCR